MVKKTNRGTFAELADAIINGAQKPTAYAKRKAIKTEAAIQRSLETQEVVARMAKKAGEKSLAKLKSNHPISNMSDAINDSLSFKAEAFIDNLAPSVAEVEAAIEAFNGVSKKNMRMAMRAALRAAASVRRRS